MAIYNAIQRIAIVGTGTIGASWATHFLARGYDVVATDPAPGAEAALRDDVQNSWTIAARLGLAADASPDRLTFTGDLSAAVMQGFSPRVIGVLSQIRVISFFAPHHRSGQAASVADAALFSGCSVT